MYTRKPKDLTKFMVGITAADALHTWEYANKTRRAQVGSDASLSVEQRKQRDLNRKTVGAYRDSKIATVASTMRGDVAKFTQAERTKREARFEKTQQDSVNSPVSPGPTLKERPLPNPSIYRPRI